MRDQALDNDDVGSPGDLAAATQIIASALVSESVHVAGLRLYAASDEQMASNIVTALAAARLEIVKRRQPSAPRA